MGSEGDAKAAIAALDGKDLDARSLRVNEDKERIPGGSCTRRPPPARFSQFKFPTWSLRVMIAHPTASGSRAPSNRSS
jgi:hypothetical protein